MRSCQKNIGWARYPRTDKDKPSRPPLGGFNIAVSAYSKNPDLAFEAAECLASPRTRPSPPSWAACRPPRESVYDDPKVQKAFPFADELRESIDARRVRGR